MPLKGVGLFYHGSQNCELTEFKSQFAVRGEGRRGVYFTEAPSLAAFYAVRRLRPGRGGRGRVYSAELALRNPIVPPPGYLKVGNAKADDAVIRTRECAAEQDAIDRGHDCLALVGDYGVIGEIAVFDPEAIRYQSTMGPPAKVAAEAVPSANLFSVYCDRTVWPLMVPEFLRSVGIVYLIDPTDGSTLMTGSDLLRPPNRAARRTASARSRQVTGPKRSLSRAAR